MAKRLSISLEINERSGHCTVYTAGESSENKRGYKFEISEEGDIKLYGEALTPKRIKFLKDLITMTMMFQ